MKEVKATDIMIGNWFHVNGFSMYIDAILRDTVYLEFEGNEGDVWEEDIKDLVPVPLTEEWLLKAGFIQERFNRHVFVKEYNENGQLVLFSPNSAVAIDNKIKGFYYWYNGNAHEVLYTHQLQNLYFVLTGTELEVQL